MKINNEDTLRVDSCSTIESVSQANSVIVMKLYVCLQVERAQAQSSPPQNQFWDCQLNETHRSR